MSEEYNKDGLTPGALVSGDDLYKILAAQRLGGGTTPVAAGSDAQQADDELDALRADYEEATGKRPHHKMKAETLQAKIDEALSAADD